MKSFFIIFLVAGSVLAAQNRPQVIKNSEEIVTLNVSNKDQPVIKLCQQYPIELNFMDENGVLTPVLDLMFEKELEPIVGLIQRFEEKNSMILLTALSHSTYKQMLKKGEDLSDILRVTKASKETSVIKVSLIDCSPKQNRIKVVNIRYQTSVFANNDFFNLVERYTSNEPQPVVAAPKPEKIETKKIELVIPKIAELKVEKLQFKDQDKPLLRLDPKKEVVAIKEPVVSKEPEIKKDVVKPVTVSVEFNPVDILGTRAEIDEIQNNLETEMEEKEPVITIDNNYSILAYVDERTRAILIQEEENLVQPLPEIVEEQLIAVAPKQNVEPVKKQKFQAKKIIDIAQVDETDVNANNEIVKDTPIVEQVETTLLKTHSPKKVEVSKTKIAKMEQKPLETEVILPTIVVTEPEEQPAVEKNEHEVAVDSSEDSTDNIDGSAQNEPEVIKYVPETVLVMAPAEPILSVQEERTKVMAEEAAERAARNQKRIQAILDKIKEKSESK